MLKWFFVLEFSNNEMTLNTFDKKAGIVKILLAVTNLKHKKAGTMQILLTVIN